MTINKGKITQKLYQILALAGSLLEELGDLRELKESVLPEYTDEKEPDHAVSNYDSQEAPGEGHVLAQPGQTCYCLACKKDIYRITKKIYGRNMGVTTFLKSFAPLNGVPAITRETIETVVRDELGVIYVDCPICKTEKSLALIGEVPKDKGSTLLGEEGKVASIDGTVFTG